MIKFKECSLYKNLAVKIIKNEPLINSESAINSSPNKGRTSMIE